MRLGGLGMDSARRCNRRSKQISALGLVVCVGLLAACTTPAEKRAPQTDEYGRQLGRITALRADGPPARIILMTVAGLQASDFLSDDGYVAGPDDRVRMPNLARLAREGVIGERVLPPSPGSVYASHATLVTGQRPSRHGIVADSRYDNEGTATLPFWNSQLIQSTALWDAAIARGVMALLASFLN